MRSRAKLRCRTTGKLGVVDSTEIGDLVSVSGAARALDGIVFDTPSRTKVVVAVVDPVRGPVFSTVHPKALSEREKEGADDPALRLLVRRTPPPLHTSARGASAGRKGRSASFTRGAPHRPTGR
jgi:hypothetical protein